MMKKVFYMFTFAALSLLAACQREENPAAEAVVFNVSATATKTSLGAESEGVRPVYWENGDQMALNGVYSDALAGLEPGTASSTLFTFHGSFSAPYRLLYPASLFTSPEELTLPSAQTWAAGNLVAVPLCGQPAAMGGTVSLQHLCAILQLRVRKDAAVSAANLESVSFKGNSGEQVCGLFGIDYATATLTPAGEGAQVTLSVNQALPTDEDLNLFLTVPAGTYADGFTVVLEDALHRSMTLSTNAITLTKGHIARGAAFTFAPSALTGTLELDAIDEEIITPSGYNVTGRVVDAHTGAGLEGVVVSDGLQCVRTLVDGSFYMTSDLSKVRFVWVSTPSGYLPPVAAGVPQFYKTKSGITPSAGIYDFGTYSLSPDTSADPDHFTILMSADPQPRGNYIVDLVAYRSDACVNDMFQELQETAAPILSGGQQVYGICLGDLTHEDMTRLGAYASALGSLGYPTYNVIGNHDNDPAGADDDEGGAPFESYFGPRNYSFNRGGLHFVVIDDIMMRLNSYNQLKNYDYGLTDDVWAWLQADMAFVPPTTKLMVCAHAPMFRVSSSSEHSNTFKHGPDYGALFDKYDEVHAWAGHTHTTFNYNYAETHRHKNIQVHTLARSTGELWTNEYLAAGTPRGFTVVEVNHGEVSWKFHPTRYQSSGFYGTYSYTSGETKYGPYLAPSYTWRDWDYVSNEARMRIGGGALTEAYQMHVYAPGAYESGYVYANIFLWDDKWETPTFSLDGGAAVPMENVDFQTEGSYDKATWEFQNYYTSIDNARRRAGSEYEVETKGLHTIFKVPCAAASGTGEVSVTDRFGNVYSRSISW